MKVISVQELDVQELFMCSIYGRFECFFLRMYISFASVCACVIEGGKYGKISKVSRFFFCECVGDVHIKEQVVGAEGV